MINLITISVFLIMHTISAFAVSITEFNAENISADANIQLHEAVEEDFELNPHILNAGHVQYFTTIVENKNLKNHKDLLDAIERVGAMEVLAPNDDDVSFLKLAYILPKTNSQAFSLELVNSPSYINNTMKDTNYIKPTKKNLANLIDLNWHKRLKKGQNFLVVKRKLPLGMRPKSIFKYSSFTKHENNLSSKNYKVAKKLNSHIGNMGRITFSRLMHCTYDQLQDSVSITQYFDLENGDGTLVISYTVARLRFGSGLFGKSARKIARKARGHEFPQETKFIVRQNRRLFIPHR